MARKVKSWSFQPQTQDLNAINQNAEELDRASANISSLAKFAMRQSQEIAQLRAIVTGLIDALHSKGAFDDTELEAAVAQAMSEAFPKGVITCTKCGRHVPESQTDITASGPVCDSCA